MYLGMIKTHNDLLLVSNSVLLYELQTLLLYLFILFVDTTANLLTSGPYALVFAYFVPFYLDIPVSKRFNVFGAHFSDKSFIYLVGVQVNNTIKYPWVHGFALFPNVFAITEQPFSSTKKDITQPRSSSSG
ncbi:hypothetical protein DY000_02028498, partial [Brassica cretica]